MFANGSLLDPTLINTVGHGAGALLFGVVLVLLVRDGRANGMRKIKLSLSAAMLAFGWNVGSLIVIGSNRPDSLFIDIVSTASFSILSLLPAVLLQVAVQGKQRSVVAGGYLISACAACLHFSEVFFGNVRLHQLALILIVAGFGALTLSAIYIRARQASAFWSQRTEWISLACLLLFTTSFLHFGYEHASSPWTAEIAWHHVGIPVALILLLQDYRFLLLDTFIRFLVNSCLAGLYIAGVILIGLRLQLFSSIQSSMFLSGLCIVGLCLSLILFAYLRNAVQGWVGRFVFRRQSIEECIRMISQSAFLAQSQEQVLESAAAHVSRHLQTEEFALLKDVAVSRPSTTPSVLFVEEDPPQFSRAHLNAKAQIPLRFSSGDMRLLMLGPRRGGRRYLSEDLDDMRRLGAAIVEHIERFQTEELRRLVSQAELRALQAQINPHFLFNSLNTLYGTIDRQSQEARQLVLNLAEIFRYVLQGNRALISLGEELRIVQAYLEIEKVRLGDRLEMHVWVPDSLHACLIPVLSLQPLVENAVKHGITSKRGAGCVSVTAQRVEGGVRIAVTDTGVGFQQSAGKVRSGTGVGIENVRKRLAICYGSRSELRIDSSAEGTSVMFDIPERVVPDLPVTEQELMSVPGLGDIAVR